MPQQPRYSTIVLTFHRDDRLRRTLDQLRRFFGDRDDHEIVLVDNNADSIYRGDWIEGFAGGATLVDLRRNLGVAEGRNVGIEVARGEILVFLDDDAVIESGFVLDKLGALFDDPKLGIVAFLSRIRSIVAKPEGVFERWIVDDKEFPHTDKSRDPYTPFETFRFIGVGHAVRAELFRRVGLYLPEFFYAMEEFDLSYRALKDGWTIRYEPDIRVKHMREKTGRAPSSVTVERSLLNKLRIAWMHLPTPQMLLCMAVWSVHTLRLPHGRGAVAAAWRKFLPWRREDHVRRAPMSPEVMGRIRAMGGQAWK